MKDLFIKNKKNLDRDFLTISDLFFPHFFSAAIDQNRLCCKSFFEEEPVSFVTALPSEIHNKLLTSVMIELSYENFPKSIAEANLHQEASTSKPKATESFKWHSVSSRGLSLLPGGKDMFFPRKSWPRFLRDLCTEKSRPQTKSMGLSLSGLFQHGMCNLKWFR